MKKIGVLVLVLLLLAAVGFARPKEKKRAFTSTDGLNGCVLAGAASATMPEESAKVFFETLLGVKLSGYHAVSTFPELLYELRSGRADAVCCPDIMAEYLLKQPEGEGLSRLTAPKDTANGTEDHGRFSFAMALRKNDTGLLEKLNKALTEMADDGTQADLNNRYLKNGETTERTTGKHSGTTYHIGVTGMLPPIDQYDDNENPCGFSKAMAEELSLRTGDRFVLVKVTEETAFTELRSGRIDAIFAYGTSKNTSPAKKDYLTTIGYQTMFEYAYLVPAKAE